jgi:hypothetical protein
VALATLAIFRWVALLLGLPIVSSWNGIASGSVFRVLNASQAFVIAEVLVLFSFKPADEPEFRWPMHIAALLGATILLLQHRTVWFATIAGVALYLAAGRIALRRFLIAALGATTAVALVVAALIRTVPAVGQALMQSVGSIAAANGTFVWRLDGWRFLLMGGYLKSFTDYGIGRPFGSGYWRFVFGQYINYSPHNFFIQTFLRTGALGTAVLMVAWGVAVRAAFKARGMEAGRSGLHEIWVVLAMQAVFSLAYAPTFEQGLLLGLAVREMRRGSSYVNATLSPIAEHPRLLPAVTTD